MKQPSLGSGTVSAETLIYQLDTQEIAVPLDSPAWYAWLEQAHSFSFRNEEGTFTAHKARPSNRRGGWYWYAYLHRRGQIFRFYLGSSSRLTLERLRNAARQLALRSQTPDRESSTSTAISTVLPSSLPAQKSPSFLTTRFHIPLLPVHHIARSRLLSQLDQGAQARLSLISAPAGSGKTTLLAAWARTSTIPIAWLSLSTAENDPARFFSYLTAALAQLDSHIGERDATLSLASYEYSWEEMLTHFVNDLTRLLTEDIVLILDDYHLITSESVHDILRFLLHSAPPQLHLFIDTRLDPPLSLAGLRAHGQLKEIRSEELRFSSTELQAFLQTMGLDLSTEEQHAFAQQTEGWIVSSHLLVLALRGQTDPASFLRARPGAHRFFLEYMSEEILAFQPAEVRDFLLQTSILERLTGSLCEAVTSQPDGQTRLIELYRSNLLLNALDDTGTWYCYQPLFAETLRTHLRTREPELIPELYRRASLWHEQHQEAEEACDYAFLAGDLPRAARLLADSLLHLMGWGKIEQLNHWLNQLPPELIASSPHLRIASIWMQILPRYTPGNTKGIIAYVEQQHGYSPTATSSIELQSELTLFHASTAFLHNDLPRAITLLQEASDALSPHKTALSQIVSLQLRIVLIIAYRIGGNLETAEQLALETCLPKPGEAYDPLNLITAWALAGLYEAQGQLHKKEQLYERIFQMLQQHANLPHIPLVLSLISRASLFYEWNRLEEASDLVQQALKIAQHTSMDILFTSSFWIQARIELAHGGAITTQPAFQRQTQGSFRLPIIEREEPPPAAIYARLALSCDQVEEAWNWERNCQKYFDDTPETDLESSNYFAYITLARVLIARGRIQHNNSAFSQALILLEHLGNLATQIGSYGWLIEIQILAALARQAQGKT
ncbi:MAG TPA: AAA family ATPase, partial [Ktedonobacteraceae bacterium]|nr:AAA family ATPase [Ktedonobacteraceae bacterium]